MKERIENMKKNIRSIDWIGLAGCAIMFAIILACVIITLKFCKVDTMSEERFRECEEIAQEVITSKGAFIEAPNFKIEYSPNRVIVKEKIARGIVIAEMQNGQIVFQREYETAMQIVVYILGAFVGFLIGAIIAAAFCKLCIYLVDNVISINRFCR